MWFDRTKPELQNDLADKDYCSHEKQEEGGQVLPEVPNLLIGLKLDPAVRSFVLDKHSLAL